MKRNALRQAARLGAVAVIVAPIVGACSGDSNIRRVGSANTREGTEVRSTVTPEGRRRVFSRAGSGKRVPINGFVWRAALDSTAFMPLVSADSLGGAIITDWYSPPESPGERFKLTVLVQGAELRSDSVKVTVFKQRRDAKGNWIDSKVARNTGYDFENVILARARDLRDQGRGR